MKKRALTLLEVLIAMSLIGIILGFLFPHFRNLAISKARIEKLESEVFPIKHAHQRLNTVFNHIWNHVTALYTEENRLDFYQLNGIDEEEDFCDLVSMSLEVKNKKLILTKKALMYVDPPKREEILLEGVLDMKWRFYLQGKNFKIEKTYEEPHSLPFMFDIILTLENKKIVTLPIFLYPLFESKNTLTWKEEKPI